MMSQLAKSDYSKRRKHFSNPTKSINTLGVGVDAEPELIRPTNRGLTGRYTDVTNVKFTLSSRQTVEVNPPTQYEPGMGCANVSEMKSRCLNDVYQEMPQYKVLHTR